MLTSKSRLVFTIASLLGCSIAQAEVLSVSFTDMNAESVEHPINKVYFNPNSDIQLAVSGGLDRRLEITLNTSAGLLAETVRTDVIGVNDRITSIGKDYYGKSITLKKPLDGSYELVAKIEDLTGKVIQTDRYEFIVDTKAPTLSDPQANSFGGLGGYDMPPDTWYTGLYSANQYFVSNIADPESGVAQVNAIITEGETVIKHAAATYDPQANQAHIGNGEGWFPGGDNATRIFGLQFEVVDKAGNKGYSKNQQTYFDSVPGSEELFAVFDPDSTNVMGGQAGYVPYVPGMEVKTNPIKIMYRIPKSDHSAYSRGGIHSIGHTSVWSDVDPDYVYVMYERPHGFTDGNFVRFADRRSWISDSISYNLKLADSAPKQPVRLGNEYQYSDIGWSSWYRQVNVEQMPVKVTASKITVEARDYDQVYEHMGSCTIPAGQTSCVITYDPPKEINLGTHGNLHDGSAIRNIDGTLYGSPRWASVHWNNEHIPSITSTEWDPKSKKVTVYANQPSRGYYFDSIRITDAYLESQGKKLNIRHTKWEENGANYKFEFDLSSLPEGTFNVEAVVKENHNNYVRAEVVSFTNDATPPQLTLYYNNSPIGSMIQGISGLTVTGVDATAMTMLDAKLSGGPTSDSVYLAFSQVSDTVFKLEQPRIFPALKDDEVYTLTVRMKDEFNNIGTATASFKYAPENWLKLEGLKTLPVGVQLQFRNDNAVALITSSELRTDSGNLATGLQEATVTLRSDAPFSILLGGNRVDPGQTKIIYFDLGDNGGKLNIPIYPADGNREGQANFMIEIPQLKSKYD